MVSIIFYWIINVDLLCVYCVFDTLMSTVCDNKRLIPTTFALVIFCEYSVNEEKQLLQVTRLESLQSLSKLFIFTMLLEGPVHYPLTSMSHFFIL